MNNIETATKAELLAYGKDIIGVTFLNAQMKVEDVREQIKLALGDADQPKVVAPPAPRGRMVPGSHPSDINHISNKDRWPVIVISPDDRDNSDVIVSPNGKSYQIKRGEEVAVPPIVLEGLQHAVQDSYPDSKTMKVVKKNRYPFSVLKQAS